MPTIDTHKYELCDEDEMFFIRDINRPFVIKFKTDLHYYIYDVNTNSICNVTASEYAIIDDIILLTKDEILSKYMPHYSPEELTDAFFNLKTALKGGFYTNKRPKELVFPYDEDSLYKLYYQEMEAMALEVTESCNLRCRYCAFVQDQPDYRSHGIARMSLETAKKAIDFLAANSKLSDKPRLGFYGGEPLLNINLIKDAVKYSKKIFGRRNLIFGTTSNCTLLTKDICNFFIENDFRLLVSMDGPKQIHDRYRKDVNAKGTFDRVIENVSQIKEIDPNYYNTNVSFNMVMMPPYDYKVISDFIADHPLIKGNRVRIGYASGDPKLLFTDLTNEQLDNSALNHVKSDFVEIMSNTEFDTMNLKSNEKFPYSFLGPSHEKIVSTLNSGHPIDKMTHPGGICIPGLKKILVNTEGRFYICEQVPTVSDIGCIGTITTGINIPKCYALIKEFTNVHQYCRHCTAFRNCGVCFSHLISNETFDPKLKLKACINNIKVFRNRLETIAQILEKNTSSFHYINDFSD